ncbi:polymorphic toxin type 15 domain-containing protein [Microbacterium sp.]|uniref:polymorphic toxin type 15 domain-containing protein n=1 Tax=Microbacterium sp. TaxID=51671 RepID=UPI003A8E95DA
MSTIKPVIRELRQAGVKAAGDLHLRLRQLLDNLDGHFDDVMRQVKDKDKYDDKVDVSLKKFKKNKNHDSTEYNRQYTEQMDTLQKTPLSDWLKNRVEYLDNGRTPDSLKAQRDARDIAEQNKLAELLEKHGGDYDKASEETAKWMKTQAATHRLDGIAGGDGTDISGVGDTRVNSSLGSQWKSRVSDIDRAVITFIEDNPGVDLSSTFINVVFR